MASRRGDATRELLLDTAERLFAEHGVYNTSLRRIRIDSGVKNTAAVHHYFVDRAGLIVALTERHVPRLGEQQRALWEHMSARSATDNPRELVELLVRPSAEYTVIGSSERSWIKIMAELGTRPETHWHNVVQLTPTPAAEAGATLYAMVEAIVPARIARERMFVLSRMAVNTCADRARRIENPSERGEPLPIEMFIANVSSMLCGALLAPLR